MKNKRPIIFNINEGKDEKDELLRIDRLLLNGEYEQVIDGTKSAIFKFPESPMFFVMQSIAYSMLDKKEEAFDILTAAERKFPTDYEVLYHLAKTYEEIDKFKEAEKYYKKSYEMTPEDDKEARSECLNDLGCIYWNMNEREKAKEQWNLALMEYPQNIKAQNNLRGFPNNEMISRLPEDKLDDFLTFQSVQFKKYLKFKRKKYIKDIVENRKVSYLIMDEWEKQIRPQINKLKSMSSQEKIDWFKHTKIDFKKMKDVDEEIIKKDIEDEEKFIDRIEEKLDFLPPGSFFLFPFLKPFLSEAGLNDERVEEIIVIGQPTELEKDILQIAVDVADTIIEMIETEDEEEKGYLFEEAVDLASEYIPKIKGRDILEMLEDDLIELLEKSGFFYNEDE